MKKSYPEIYEDSGKDATFSQKNDEGEEAASPASSSSLNL